MSARSMSVKTVLLVLAASLGLSAQTSTPTFNKEVVRIFQNNCQTCHHPGDIGPFSLMDYKSARPWARSIQEYVVGKKMPPWKPSQGADIFRAARGLSQADINTVSAWVDAGAPECIENLSNQACKSPDPDLPAQLSFPDGWALGQPDLVVKMSSPFAVYGSGNDIYRCFSIPTNLPADTYVSAVHIRPGNRAVDHHVILYSDPKGQSVALDKGSGYPCYGDGGVESDISFFGGWAPGIRPAFLSPGTAMLLHKNTYIAMQIHYHPNGVDTVDQTDVGIYFAKGPVDKTVYFVPLVNTDFKIPAGANHYQVDGFMPALYSALFGNLHIVSIAPHMHLLGKESHVTVASGTKSSPLIDINDWDFQWQGIYDFLQPVALPTTSTIKFTKFYDNSNGNAKNPNSPLKDVGWGEQTTDEMAVVFFGGTRDADHMISPTFAKENIVSAASFASGIFAPGEIVSLFGVGLGSDWAAASGTLPTTLAKSTINVSGVTAAAPLFYASPSQVNFQIPYEASGAAKLTFKRGDDNKTTVVDLVVGEAHPGLFSTDSSGTGPAAATRADSSFLNSGNPAARGEVVVLYATGLGRVNPGATTGKGSDGAASVVNQVKVNIGGRVIDPDYAGLTPGYVGLYQVNFRIPADLVATGDVALKITEAGVDSNTVTIAVR